MGGNGRTKKVDGIYGASNLPVKDFKK